MSASFCWECGKKLQRVKGELVFTEVTLPNATSVRMHKTCAENYQKPAPEHAQAGTKNAVRKYLGEEDLGVE